MKPLVSILIPIYNAENYLRETISSALNQTWQNIEIILVDDGSTDNSLEIAQQFASPQVKIISQSNRGASAARNRALMEAQGDFIQYLDADDLLCHNKIALQIEMLKKGIEDCVIAGEWGRFYTAPSEALFVQEQVWQDMDSIDWLLCSWLGGGMMHPAAWLTPRNIADKSGSWNENLSLNDDGEYFCRVLLESKGIKFCWGARSYYRSGNSNSLSGLKSSKACESVFLSLDICTKNLLAKENSVRTRRACANLFQRFIYEYYPEANDLLIKVEEKIIELGGSDIEFINSPLFEFFKSFLGWKIARRLQIIQRNLKQGIK
ncbi:glycosyltransferase family 2 protein [Pseudanabaena yagii]|uniref:Glycosyltransferase family 2 protein n=1 Tax=Pseudanabaena yagii GIHE-NHR1 TaxID=2722753 RepID=A0ABX1LMG5_9CYAN|nr:glycosyltransferase family A protein [Pseudanabaena yagii]NMF56631.1 glycosyltransferase family 2 protein [Pseudanabaena yagii GIHE-NHR1]